VYAVSRSLASTSTGWDVADVTDGEAVGDPSATVLGDTVHVVYWDKDDQQSHLSRTAGTWHHERLAGTAAAGAAIGFEHENTLHVVCRAGALGHLFDLCPAPVDLTAAARDAQNHPPPAATYRPASYQPVGATPRIVFRALRGSVWEIERGMLSARNLGALALKASGAGAGIIHAPHAVGSPTAVAADIARIFYRSADGTIIEIFDEGGTVRWREVCAGAAADPTAWVDATGAMVSFRGEDGHAGRYLGGCRRRAGGTMTDDARHARRARGADSMARPLPRFALAEAKPQLEIRHADARTTIIDGSATAELDDDQMIEAVMGRLEETSGFSAKLRALLSRMP
jgi:hypothetical protein